MQITLNENQLKRFQAMPREKQVEIISAQLAQGITGGYAEYFPGLAPVVPVYNPDISKLPVSALNPNRVFLYPVIGAVLLLIVLRKVIK